MFDQAVNVPQIREFLNEVVQTPQKIFELLRTDVRASMGRYLNQLMESEITLFLGRRPYERSIKRWSAKSSE